MIDRLQNIAERLAFTRSIFAVLGLAGAGAAAYELLGAGFGETDYLAPALVLMLWSLVTFAAIGLFREVPPLAPDNAGTFARLRRRLARGFYHLLALAFIALTLAGLYMSWKVLTLT